MSTKPRSISQINLVARHFDETLKFYRLLGLDIPAPMSQPPGSLHAPSNLENGFEFQIDNEHHARIYNAGWRRPTGSSSLLLTVYVENREDVDSTYVKLIAAGYEGRQEPFDAFWGARFAIVADPEGNDVGLMSPAESRFEFWPPVDAPAP